MAPQAEETQVSDTDTETTETAAPSNTELAGRIDGLESKLDVLIDKLSGKEDQAHAAAEKHTEDRLDRPSTIAEQIREQLAEAKAREAADAEKRGHADRLAAVEQKLEGMAEKTPEAPQRRIEKILGWR